MPSKRPSPLENPPSASSSEGEEEEEEEEMEEEEEEEDIAGPKSSMKKPVTKPEPAQSPGPLTQSSSSNASSSSDDEDEESGSESDPSPEKPKSNRPSRGADLEVKPISSKPMDDTLKPKKPTATTMTTPTKSAPASKRHIETDKAEKDLKRKKKKVSDAEEEDLHLEETNKKPGDDPKKLFQRLWSDEDEIVILKGMVNYLKKGLNPTADMNAFLDFIKKSLHIDVNRGQLNNKVQRLKKKFHNNARRAKNGEDPTFSKPHELKSYLLSKKIWGEEEGKEDGHGTTEANNVGGSMTPDEKKIKSQKVSNELISSRPESLALQKNRLELVSEEEDKKSRSLYPTLSESLNFGKNLTMPPPDLGENLMKEGLSLIGSSKVKELEERWKKVKIAEAKAYLDRVELVRDQLKIFLDAIESSKS